jgi:hypothetical protein
VSNNPSIPMPNSPRKSYVSDLQYRRSKEHRDSRLKNQSASEKSGRRKTPSRMIPSGAVLAKVSSEYLKLQFSIRTLENGE